MTGSNPSGTPTDDAAPQPHADTQLISRRSLLVATAGLSAASVTLAGAKEALAQETTNTAAHMHGMETATSDTPAGSLSNRLYNVNKFKGVVDIARDPPTSPPRSPVPARTTCAWTSRRSKLRRALTSERRIRSGRSMAACLDRSSACALATPSKSTLKTMKTAS